MAHHDNISEQSATCSGPVGILFAEVVWNQHLRNILGVGSILHLAKWIVLSTISMNDVKLINLVALLNLLRRSEVIKSPLLIIHNHGGIVVT